MAATVETKKGSERIVLGFSNKYFADQFMSFCRTFQLIQAEENARVYVLSRSWPKEVNTFDEDVLLELDPLAVSVMLATINEKLGACHGLMRVNYAGKPEGIVFSMNTSFKGTPMGVLAGLLYPLII